MKRQEENPKSYRKTRENMEITLKSLKQLIINIFLLKPEKINNNNMKFLIFQNSNGSVSLYI